MYPLASCAGRFLDCGRLWVSLSSGVGPLRRPNCEIAWGREKVDAALLRRGAGVVATDARLTLIAIPGKGGRHVPQTWHEWASWPIPQPPVQTHRLHPYGRDGGQLKTRPSQAVAPDRWVSMRLQRPRCAALRAMCDMPWRTMCVASPTGLEPVTPNLEGLCSIQMSYGLESSPHSKRNRSGGD